MGEYAIRKSDNRRIKIGTCENMYYVRYEDRNKLIPEEESLDCAKTDGLKWRLPFPDEDTSKIGNYGPMRTLPLSKNFKINADPDLTTGTMRIESELGIRLNITCYHGLKLPCNTQEVTFSFDHLISREPFFDLCAVKNTGNRLYPVVRCNGCGEQWQCDWNDVIPYVENDIIKQRLIEYSKI